MMKFRDFFLRDDGASLAEYAIIAALVSIVCCVALTSIGSSVAAFFSNMASDI